MIRNLSLLLGSIVRSTLGNTAAWRIKALLDKISPRQRALVAKRMRFYAEFVKKGDICFDVGANYGNRVAPLLKLGASVVAIEPQIECLAVLHGKFGSKINIVPKGLGEKEGSKTFYIANESTISSFSEDWINAVKKDRFKEYSWEQQEEVQMTTLDNLINEFGHPAFIKIDVEGYELEVLRGLSAPAKVISFEYTVPEQFQKIGMCIDQVLKANSNVICNYAIGEDTEWALPAWLNVDDFLRHTETDLFLNSGFGDIYLKSSKL